MTKILSFFVFISAFVWTWYLFNSQSKINYEIHAGLQSKLSLLIEETIKNAKPNTYNFQMLSLSTETVDENKVDAHFAYRFTEKLEDKEISQQTVKGQLTLNRTASENSDDQKWVIQAVKTDNSAIEFQEGLVIGSGPETKPATEPAAETTAAPAVDAAQAAPSAPKETQPTQPPANEEKKTE